MVSEQQQPPALTVSAVIRCGSQLRADFGGWDNGLDDTAQVWIDAGMSQAAALAAVDDARRLIVEQWPALVARQEMVADRQPAADPAGASAAIDGEYLTLFERVSALAGYLSRALTELHPLRARAEAIMERAGGDGGDYWPPREELAAIVAEFEGLGRDERRRILGGWAPVNEWPTPEAVADYMGVAGADGAVHRQLLILGLRDGATAHLQEFTIDDHCGVQFQFPEGISQAEALAALRGAVKAVKSKWQTMIREQPAALPVFDVQPTRSPGSMAHQLKEANRQLARMRRLVGYLCDQRPARGGESIESQSEPARAGFSLDWKDGTLTQCRADFAGNDDAAVSLMVNDGVSSAQVIDALRSMLDTMAQEKSGQSNAPLNPLLGGGDSKAARSTAA